MYRPRGQLYGFQDPPQWHQNDYGNGGGENENVHFLCVLEVLIFDVARLYCEQYDTKCHHRGMHN